MKPILAILILASGVAMTGCGSEHRPPVGLCWNSPSGELVCHHEYEHYNGEPAHELSPDVLIEQDSMEDK